VTGSAAKGAPRLPYRPNGAHYVVGIDANAIPMTRNVLGRKRPRVLTWLSELDTSAAAVAAATTWIPGERYGVVIEVRIPWDADLDNFLKDILDRAAQHGMFGGNDINVDLVHATKRTHVNEAEAGARVEVWRLPA
jgi:hypothetical protein